MRVTRVRVGSWRNLRDIDLEIDPESSLVCLVGENGTGKSTVLELLSAASHHLGIAQGVEIPRGNPFDEEHEIEVEVRVPPGEVMPPDQLMTAEEQLGGQWNGELRLQSRRSPERDGPITVQAGGVKPDIAEQVAVRVTNQLRQRQETQHLYLDADRAYPPMQIEAHRYQEIWQQQWDNPEFTRQWAFRPTRTLYEEWMKYFLGVEERSATDHITAIRRARDARTADPQFVDPFDSYRQTLQVVLPHLRFVGVESSGAQRAPLFDSAGKELTFSRLSGGEREIAFLIGQIERFRLRRGLLLIDEPELHLNPDLLRNWLAFLRDTIRSGQVWIATHSLEAVEVAGPDSTFVFERDRDSRTVTAPKVLAGRPVLSALSAAVGSPAFALSRLRFVYVEGDRQSRERERFYTLCGDSDTNRFLEGGSCSEVLRRLAHVRALADETDEQLRVGGVVDRDFRTEDERNTLQANSGVHVLGCLEIENLYLHPESVAVLLARSGRMDRDAMSIIRDCADNFAGLWVAQHAAARLSPVHDVPKLALTVLSNKSFGQLEDGWVVSRDTSTATFVNGEQDRWRELLDAAWELYRSRRASDEWYRECLGKQTLGRLAADLDFRSAQALERQLVSLWGSAEGAIPPDLIELRSYTAQL